MNSIIIHGRLTADVELRQTPGGKNVCGFTVAVDRRGKDAGADFIECVAWDKTAEVISKHFTKGQQIVVRGRLQVRNYEDKDGNKRKAFDVIVEEFGFCGKAENRVAPGFTALSDESDLPF